MLDWIKKLFGGKSDNQDLVLDENSSAPTVEEEPKQEAPVMPESPAMPETPMENNIPDNNVSFGNGDDNDMDME